MERVAHICYSFNFCTLRVLFGRSSVCLFRFLVEWKLPDFIKAINGRKIVSLRFFFFFFFIETVKLFTKLHRMRAYNSE